jgi:hypothetical protein
MVPRLPPRRRTPSRRRARLLRTPRRLPRGPAGERGRARARADKRPEQRLPLILIISPGLTDTQPASQADKTFNTEWALTLSGIVHGKNEDEAELMASCYGLALVQMINQQAGGWADLPAYLGPPLTVENVEWMAPGLDFNTLEVSRRRSIVAAEANFAVVFRDSATSLGPPSPPVDPTVDPGDWPEVITTELQIDKEA